MTCWKTELTEVKVYIKGEMYWIFGESFLGVFYTLILLLLLFIGFELRVDSIYWIVWGIAFAIETINLFGAAYNSIDNEEDNDK